MESLVRSLTEGQATVAAGVLAGAFAALGYVGKLLFEGIGTLRDRRNERIAGLVELHGLLRATRAVYESQNRLARRLASSVRTNHQAFETETPLGFERLFSEAYAKMTESERAEHGVLRSMSEYSMKPLNDAILEWLKLDAYWKAPSRSVGVQLRLARALAALEAHLYLWRAKYAYWMAEPQHALVYLADEDAHGIGFPKEVDALVEAVLQSRALPSRIKSPPT